MFLSLIIVAFVFLTLFGILLVAGGAWNVHLRKREPLESFSVFNALPRTPLISHRGGSNSAPENTMMALENAVFNCKTDILEVDLQVTKDGHVVLIHDLTIDRTTNGQGFVEQMELEELQRYDAGYGFVDGSGNFSARGKGVRIPTLEEVLQRFSEERFVYFFDFKSAKAIIPTLEMIYKYQLEKRVICGAVLPRINMEMKKQLPHGIPTAADRVTMVLLFLLHKVGLDWVIENSHEIAGFIVNKATRNLYSKSFFERIKARGAIVAVFGPLTNTESDVEFWMDLGAQFVFTDNPEMMRRMREEGRI